MEHDQPLSFRQLFAHVVRDMAIAISERPNESKQHQFIRTQVATQMILGLGPRDVVEAMLAGQTVMFHAVMADSIHDTLQGEVDTRRRSTRANIVGLNRAFHMNLGKLAEYLARPSESGAASAKPHAEFAAPEAERRDAPPEPERSDAPPEPVAPLAPAPPDYEEEFLREAPAEVIAACQANPEAMAALRAGDPERFARAMGVQLPEGDFNGPPAGNQPRRSQAPASQANVSGDVMAIEERLAR